MSRELIGALAILVLFFLMAWRTWIGIAMAFVGFIGIWLLRSLPQALSIVGSVPFAKVSNYSFTAIPMFLFMGLIIAETDIGAGLYRAANAWLGRVRGGLASATAVACGFLGAICSVTMTGAIIMSKIAYPEMKKRGYEDGFACASIGAGAPLSIIIPPSMCFIMYGILTENSVGRLFISGIVPGLILTVCYCIAVAIVTRLKPDWGPKGDKLTFRQKLAATKDVIPVGILFLLVLGGIYTGFVSTTESGAVGAIGALLIAVFTRQMTWEKLFKCIRQTARIGSAIWILMAGTYIFSSFLTLSNLPQAIAGLATSLHATKYVGILMVVLIYIILGMFIPDNVIVVLTVPILYPVMVNTLGCDPIWFGTFVVFMVSLAQISPPVGMVVYYLGGLTGVPIQKIFRGIMPFLICMIFVVVLMIAFPAISTWLPSVMR